MKVHKLSLFRGLFAVVLCLLVMVCCVMFSACNDEFIGKWRYFDEGADGGMTLVINEGGVGDILIEGDGDWADFAEDALGKYEFSYEYSEAERTLKLTVAAFGGASLSGHFDEEFTRFIVDYPISNMVFTKIS